MYLRSFERSIGNARYYECIFYSFWLRRDDILASSFSQTLDISYVANREMSAIVEQTFRNVTFCNLVPSISVFDPSHCQG